MLSWVSVRSIDSQISITNASDAQRGDPEFPSSCQTFMLPLLKYFLATRICYNLCLIIVAYLLVSTSQRFCVGQLRKENL